MKLDTGQVMVQKEVHTNTRSRHSMSICCFCVWGTAAVERATVAMTGPLTSGA